MSRLRLIEQGQDRDRQVPDPARVALEVAADAEFNRPPRGRGLTEGQLSALEAAARFVGVPLRTLEAAVRGAGDCCEQDSEQWFPVYREDPARGEGRAAERALARQLCGACPVRAQCLALDYAHVDGHVQHLWGIYGGLGARDRRELLPLWMELSTRLAGSARAGGVEPNWDTTVPEVAPSRPVAS